MSEDLIRYDRMVEKALRSVVREALSVVAKNQTLPGDHHFFITFQTDAPGVAIPAYLQKQYPEEMTIVLQYQFSELIVTDETMEVTLSFNNKPERLIIPLSAITTFADPAVSFALQFQSVDLDEFEEGTFDDDDEPSPKPPLPEGGAKVVTLDAFRKKNQE